jgi:hypothetical protein
MRMSLQEIHYYNNLVEHDNYNNLITCPFDKDDVIVTRADENDEPEFYCLHHKNTFKINDSAKSEIKKIIINSINNK